MAEKQSQQSQWRRKVLFCTKTTDIQTLILHRICEGILGDFAIAVRIAVRIAVALDGPHWSIRPTSGCLLCFDLVKRAGGAGCAMHCLRNSHSQCMNQACEPSLRTNTLRPLAVPKLESIFEYAMIFGQRILWIGGDVPN